MRNLTMTAKQFLDWKTSLLIINIWHKFFCSFQSSKFPFLTTLYKISQFLGGEILWKLCGSCESPKNLHIRKLVEISVFYELRGDILLQLIYQSISKIQIKQNQTSIISPVDKKEDLPKNTSRESIDLKFKKRVNPIITFNSNGYFDY